MHARFTAPRHTSAGPAHWPTPARPGVVLVGMDGTVLWQTAAGEQWLDALDDGHGWAVSGRPAAVQAVVGQHRHATACTPGAETLLRTRACEWTAVTPYR